MTTDPYTVLGVKRSDTLEEIKKAFHRLAHTHHPDKGGDAEKFKEVSAAWADIQRSHTTQPAYQRPINPNGKDLFKEAMERENARQASMNMYGTKWGKTRVEFNINGTKVDLDEMDPRVAEFLNKIFNS